MHKKEKKKQEKQNKTSQKDRESDQVSVNLNIGMIIYGDVSIVMSRILYSERNIFTMGQRYTKNYRHNGFTTHIICPSMGINVRIYYLFYLFNPCEHVG